MLRQLLGYEIRFPPMVRRLFTFGWALASVLSLLLCAATSALSIWAAVTSSHEIGYQRRDESFRLWVEALPPLALPIDSAIMSTMSLLIYYYLRRQAKRHRVGICQACGYDLCATPDRCPECGNAPVKAGISN